MGKIRQLDETLSNKISAGEVVERPASVVKELVENAIDANSTIVEIDIEEAGLARIRVIDNGDGMDEEDVRKAFMRHATSKIKDDHDLFHIRSLGFRGEALPSIASVSRMEMKTSTGDIGTAITVMGGKVEAIEAASCRKGTDIVVTELFYNTPARLKYLKTISTELGNISDIVNRLALSHPEISFRLTHNGRNLLHTNGNGDVLHVLASIYGMSIAKKMIPLEASSLDFQVSGWIALPEVTRASRNYITTLINGRFIKNYPLVKAIQEGYHTLLPIGRFPIVLLNINMDPVLVDVNVHPSKMEVRLSKEGELNELVTTSIRNTFKKRELIPSGFIQEKKEKHESEQTFLELDHLPLKGEMKPVTGKVIPESFSREGENIKEPQPIEKNEIFPLTGKNTEDFNAETQRDESPVVRESHYFMNEDDYKVKEENTSRVPPLYPVGQMHGTYIFAQNEKGLYIIDQHAAQERINYEFFKEKVGEVRSELQEMLVPLMFEYSTNDYLKIIENQNELEAVGVFIEQFGHNSFIIRSHPTWFLKGKEKEIIEEMIEQLLQMKKVDIKKLREEAAIMMSCKAAIKANRYLKNEEIQALLDELRRTSDPFTCPHGRPIIIHYSTYELEKMFKRVM